MSSRPATKLPGQRSTKKKSNVDEACQTMPSWYVNACKSDGVVVAFIARWCNHCTKFHPAIDRAAIAARNLPRRSDIMAVEAPEIMPLSLRAQVVALGINAYPTVVRLRVDGEGALRIVNRFSGARTSCALLDFARWK